jgi:hypothetical protein
MPFIWKFGAIGCAVGWGKSEIRVKYTVSDRKNQKKAVPILGIGFISIWAIYK